MINRILHGCLFIRNFSSHVQLDISPIRCNRKLTSSLRSLVRLRFFTWDVKLNTQRDAPYVHSTMYYTLYNGRVSGVETQALKFIIHDYCCCFFQVLYCETPCNPTNILTDLEEFAKLGKSLGIITMVDSTFASPFNQTPIKQGIDVVIHSWYEHLFCSLFLWIRIFQKGLFSNQQKITQRVTKTHFIFPTYSYMY